MYQDYLDLLPEYRGVPHLDAMQVQRAFFGFVPNWHDSPIQPVATRILPIGDAAGNRSALSFAGAKPTSYLHHSSLHELELLPSMRFMCHVMLTNMLVQSARQQYY